MCVMLCFHTRIFEFNIFWYHLSNSIQNNVFPGSQSIASHSNVHFLNWIIAWYNWKKKPVVYIRRLKKCIVGPRMQWLPEDVHGNSFHIWKCYFFWINYPINILNKRYILVFIYWTNLNAVVFILVSLLIDWFWYRYKHHHLGNKNN